MALQCSACGESFQSRNRLFAHLKASSSCAPRCDVGEAGASRRFRVGLLLEELCEVGIGHDGIRQVLASAGAFDVDIDIRRPASPQGTCVCAVQCRSQHDTDLLMHCLWLEIIRWNQRHPVDLRFQLIDMWRLAPDQELDVDTVGVRIDCSQWLCQPVRLADVVTVVLTTSPVQCDPELDIIENAVSSLKLAGLDSCAKVLICDHFGAHEIDPAQLRQLGHRNDMKSGQLPAEYCVRYRQRIAALRSAAWASDVEIVELDQWHGLSLACKRSLDFIKTPLVCFVQHDLAFMQALDMAPIAEALLKRDWLAGPVNLVSFPGKPQRNYRDRLRERSGGLDVGDPVTFQATSDVVSLTRLPQFNGGIHIARRDWYQNLFLRAERHEPLRPILNKGALLEDIVGQHIFRLAKRSVEKVSAGHDLGLASLGVLNVSAEFGCWIYHVADPGGYITLHARATREYSQQELRTRVRIAIHLWHPSDDGIREDTICEVFSSVGANDAKVDLWYPMGPQGSGAGGRVCIASFEHRHDADALIHRAWLAVLRWNNCHSHDLRFQLIDMWRLAPNKELDVDGLGIRIDCSHWLCQPVRVADVVTVVFTTSPMRCDPELDIIENAVKSLKLAGLDTCAKVLICDHFDAQEIDPTQPWNRNDLKAGHIPAEHCARYRQRIAALKSAEWASDVKIVELDTWHGFSLACKRSLDFVKTPLVCVVQHDLAFMQVVDMASIAEVLLKRDWLAGPVNFVNFPRILQRNYRERLRQRSRGLDAGDPVSFRTASGATALTRLPFFNDGIHIARLDWYRNLYRRAERDEPLRPILSRGIFTEDFVGQHMLRLAKRSVEKVSAGPELGSASLGVLNVCAEFGCWIYHVSDPEGYITFHLHGAVHSTQLQQELQAQYDQKVGDGADLA